jgi:hypothetical protein
MYLTSYKYVFFLKQQTFKSKYQNDIKNKIYFHAKQMLCCKALSNRFKRAGIFSFLGFMSHEGKKLAFWVSSLMKEFFCFLGFISNEGNIFSFSWFHP